MAGRDEEVRSAQLKCYGVTSVASNGQRVHSRSEHCTGSSMDRASDYGSEGSGFESLPVRQEVGGQNGRPPAFLAQGACAHGTPGTPPGQAPGKLSPTFCSWRTTAMSEQDGRMAKGHCARWSPVCGVCACIWVVTSSPENRSNEALDFEERVLRRRRRCGSSMPISRRRRHRSSRRRRVCCWPRSWRRTSLRRGGRLGHAGRTSRCSCATSKRASVASATNPAGETDRRVDRRFQAETLRQRRDQQQPGVSD